MLFSVCRISSTYLAFKRGCPCFVLSLAQQVSSSCGAGTGTHFLKVDGFGSSMNLPLPLLFLLRSPPRIQTSMEPNWGVQAVVGAAWTLHLPVMQGAWEESPACVPTPLVPCLAQGRWRCRVRNSAPVPQSCPHGSVPDPAPAGGGGQAFGAVARHGKSHVDSCGAKGLGSRDTGRGCSWGPLPRTGGGSALQLRMALTSYHG